MEEHTQQLPKNLQTQDTERYLSHPLNGPVCSAKTKHKSHHHPQSNIHLASPPQALCDGTGQEGAVAFRGAPPRQRQPPAPELNRPAG